MGQVVGRVAVTEEASLPERLPLHAEAVLADTGVQSFTPEEVVRRSGERPEDVAGRPIVRVRSRTRSNTS